MQYRILAATAALALTATPAMAQDNSPRDPIRDILGALFGERTPSGSLESQWAAGRTPLTQQRGAFEAKVDQGTRAGTLTSATAARLKYDYYQLTQLETRYGADRRYTAQERQELMYGYERLTQVLADGSYADNATDILTGSNSESAATTIAQGRNEFERRVDSAVARRVIRRSVGTRLKSDYTALIDIESAYLSDGVLTTAERDDLETRLATLEARVEGNAYNPASMTATERLNAIATALPRSALSGTERAQLQVEHQDLARLTQAYGRITTSSDERNYLDRRLADLETRVGLRR